MAIAVVGMLDEREEALKIIKDQIEKRGHQVILIDVTIGTGAIATTLKADVGSDELARLAGGTLEGLRRCLPKRETRPPR